jgi:hypothetical protein
LNVNRPKLFRCRLEATLFVSADLLAVCIRERESRHAGGICHSVDSQCSSLLQDRRIRSEL